MLICSSGGSPALLIFLLWDKCDSSLLGGHKQTCLALSGLALGGQLFVGAAQHLKTVVWQEAELGLSSTAGIAPTWLIVRETWREP